MKHIKNFENFELNELSGAYIDKAYHKANSESDSDDEITSTLKKRQAGKFSNYVNPSLKNRVNKLGIDIRKANNNSYVLLVKGKSVALVDYDGKAELTIHDLDSNTLKKIQRISGFVKDDHTSDNEL